MFQESVQARNAVQAFETDRGARIYQIALQEFPILWGYVYAVRVTDGDQEYRVLIDSGSGYGDSNPQLEAGLQVVSEREGIPFGLQDLTHVLITHGHIDHFGGLSYVRPRTPAKIGVHELDLRNLTNYEERLVMIAPRLRQFLQESGVSNQEVDSLIQLYTFTKQIYRSVEVDFTYEEAGMRLGPFEMLHVPGHCAGHVAIRLHDILFSGDHVLNDISPHQSPEHLTLSTGLEHYLKSLDVLQYWAGEVRLTLGGHKDIITDLPARLDAIRQIHHLRLDNVLQLLDTPNTIAEVSRVLFGKVHGYNVLLALEEAGAHVEYLYQRGLLGIANLKELESSATPVPIQYQRIHQRGG